MEFKLKKLLSSRLLGVKVRRQRNKLRFNDALVETRQCMEGVGQRALRNKRACSIALGMEYGRFASLHEPCGIRLGFLIHSYLILKEAAPSSLGKKKNICAVSAYTS